MIDELTYKKARATILRAVFVDHLDCEQTAKLVKKKYGVDYEEVAQRMDDEDFKSKAELARCRKKMDARPHIVYKKKLEKVV